MSQLIDFYTDTPGIVFDQIKRRYDAEGKELPPFVLGHRAMSDDERSKLTPGEFAWPDKRMFPISSKADTWRSISYFNVLKSAALSLESSREREGIRSMLAKAASMWGLDDEEVENLVHDVNLTMPKEASAETSSSEIVAFATSARSMPEPERREHADMLLKAAESEGIELGDGVRRAMLQHAGAATCTAKDAELVISGIIRDIPWKSDYMKPLHDLRGELRKTASAEIMPPDDVSQLVGYLEEIVDKYHLKTAVSEDLRLFTLDDANEVVAEAADKIRLPGGIIAKKSAIEQNERRIGVHLHNHHDIDAYGGEEIEKALQTLTPNDIISLRPLIGA